MSREIKFRAWDIDNKKYEYDIAIRPINGIIDVEIFNNEMYPVEFRGIVEQYTGLKDKNGKEIYEGDIIQTQYMNARGWVVWNDGAWSIRLLKDSLVELFLAEEVGVGCEVIGNIHENKELLGGDE